MTERQPEYPPEYDAVEEPSGWEQCEDMLTLFHELNKRTGSFGPGGRVSTEGRVYTIPDGSLLREMAKATASMAAGIWYIAFKMGDRQ